MLAIHGGEALTMPPSVDDAAFANKFIDELIDRVRDVPTMRVELDALKREAGVWREDHNSIVHAQTISKVLKYVTPGLQALMVAVLVPMFYFLVELRDGKIEQGRDISDLRVAMTDLRQSMQTRTYMPSDWESIQENVANLVDANKVTGENIAKLTQQVDNLTRTMARMKPPRVDVHPTSTIVIQKPDQSRAARIPPLAPGFRP